MLNVTCTSIVSLRSKVSPTAGEPIVKPVTDGATKVPSTLCAALFEIAFVPKLRVAADPPDRASLIVPPFSANALAPMLIPSVSVSAAATA